MKDQLFMCTVIPGAEQTAAEELIDQIKDIVIKKTARGKIFFWGNVLKNELCKLRCIDNVYFVVSEFVIGPYKEDLEKYYSAVFQLNLNDAISSIDLKEKPCIIVSASRKGHHTYSRFDLSELALKAFLSANDFNSGDSKHHNMAIRIDVDNNNCMVSIQMTAADFKFRGETYNFMPGGIRPTVAGILVRLCKPSIQDVFYDPFCGSGTIVRERCNFAADKIMGSDINPDCVQAAKANLSAKVNVFCCDARKMKIPDDSVDVIVSNIPWGKQIEVKDISKLYEDFLFEAKRVLYESGRMLLLTDQKEELKNAADLVGFQIREITILSLHGLLPGIFYLTFKNSDFNPSRKSPAS